jgi:hypothetical protein
MSFNQWEIRRKPCNCRLQLFIFPSGPWFAGQAAAHEVGVGSRAADARLFLITGPHAATSFQKAGFLWSERLWIVKQMWSKCSRMINHSYATQFECLQSESPCSQEIWTNVTAFVTRISKSEFQRLVVLRSEGSVFFPFSCYVASTAFAAASACGVHLLEVPKGMLHETVRNDIGSAWAFFLYSIPSDKWNQWWQNSDQYTWQTSPTFEWSNFLETCSMLSSSCLWCFQTSTGESWPWRKPHFPHLSAFQHRWFSGEVERPIARIVPWKQKSDLRGSSMMFNGAIDLAGIHTDSRTVL